MVCIVQDCFAVGRPRACVRAIRAIRATRATRATRAIRAWHSGLTRQMCLTIMEYRLGGIVGIVGQVEVDIVPSQAW